MEAVVVGVGHFVALGIVEAERGLEPAGHGVGEVGDQFARAGGDDQLLALGGLEAIAVHAAGHDLAVDDGGQRDVHGRLAARRRACPRLACRLRAGIAGGASLAGCLENSGSWPTQNTSGLDSPSGVPSRSSRSPGSASAAMVTCERARSRRWPDWSAGARTSASFCADLGRSSWRSAGGRRWPLFVQLLQPGRAAR